MIVYHYSFSYYTRKNRLIFVVAEDGELVFTLKQNRFFFVEMQRFFSKLFNYSYRIESIQSKEILYSIYKKTAYYLKMNNKEKKIQIKQQRMQLIEKRQIFSIDNNHYSFEITATRSGLLKMNDKIVATIKILNLLEMKDDYEVAVEAVDEANALLCIVCYQTFHLASYETNYIQ